MAESRLFEKHKKKTSWAALLLFLRRSQKILYVMVSVVFLFGSFFMFAGIDVGQILELAGQRYHMDSLVRLGASLRLSENKYAAVGDEAALVRTGGGFSMAAYLQEAGGVMAAGAYKAASADLVKSDPEMAAEMAAGGPGAAVKDADKAKGKDKPKPATAANPSDDGPQPVDVSQVLGPGGLNGALTTAFANNSSPGSVSMAEGGGNLFEGTVGAMDARSRFKSRFANPFGGMSGNPGLTGARGVRSKLSGAFSHGAGLAHTEGAVGKRAILGRAWFQLLYTRDCSVYASGANEGTDAHAYAGAPFDGNVNGLKVQEGDVTIPATGSGLTGGNPGGGGGGGGPHGGGAPAPVAPPDPSSPGPPPDPPGAPPPGQYDNSWSGLELASMIATMTMGACMTTAGILGTVMWSTINTELTQAADFGAGLAAAAATYAAMAPIIIGFMIGSLVASLTTLGIGIYSATQSQGALSWLGIGVGALGAIASVVELVKALSPAGITSSASTTAIVGGALGLVGGIAAIILHYVH